MTAVPLPQPRIDSFDTPSTVLFGAGCRSHLTVELQQLGANRILVVTDKHLLSTGLIAEFDTQFRSANIQSTLFFDVQPDPTDLNVMAGLASAQASEAQTVVAIGGGSVIDAAKMIAITARNDAPLPSFQGYGKIPQPGLPLLVIPTTAGTGSEVTKAAVITDTERQVKMMIFDRKLMPHAAIVDYELSMTMPAQLTAFVGIDTLAHGIEAFVSRKAFGMTDSLALSCVRLTSLNLPIAFAHPENREAREAMALAACQGGMAFTNSSVCLVHGMSRPIGALFHLAHGLSNAVLLPTVTRFSLAGARERYLEIARAMGLAAGTGLADGLENLNRQLGVGRLRDYIAMPLSEFETHLHKMANDALASGSPQNNPVVPSAEQIIELYKEAW